MSIERAIEWVVGRGYENHDVYRFLLEAQATRIGHSDLGRLILSELPTRGGPATRIDADVLALVLVLEQRETAPTRTEVCDALGIPWATTSDLINRAIAAGYVTSFVAASDKRRHLLRLSPKALRFRKRRRATF